MQRLSIDAWPSQLLREGGEGGRQAAGEEERKQTNASHYCSVRLCSALGNPSQSAQIQLLLLNQFEAAATSHLSQ